MTVYRTSDAAFEGVPDYPFAPNYLDQDGLRMHYVEVVELLPGAGPAETLEGAGHFLQEDKGNELGERIASWLGAA